MLKKVLIVGAGVLLLAGLFCAPFTRSHIMTMWGKGSQMVSEMETIEYQLERARHLLSQIDPEIRQANHTIAKQQIEVEQLRDDVSDNTAVLNGMREDMVTMKSHYDSGESVILIGTRSYTRDRVRKDLKARFTKFQTKEATVDKMQKILEAREKGLDAAHQKLAEMRNAKSQLEIQIENLEARLEMVRLAETSSKVNFDDSTLSQTKELVQHIKTRIDVAEKVVNADTDFSSDLIPLEDAEDEVDISDEIADYFGEGRAELEALASDQ